MLRELISFYILIASTFSSFIGPRILGGGDAAEGEYGHAVVIRRHHISMCGGSLLNERFVLTASHCFYNSFSQGIPISAFSIQYGTTLNTKGKNATNVIGVKNVTLHPYFQPVNPRKNDIAIIELEEPIEFSWTVYPINLPPAYNATPENATATLVGWGRTFNDDHMSKHLKDVDIRVYPDKECQKVHNTTNNENHICAGSPELGKMQCKGDSGGPLTIGDVQIGVVSWSKKPCGLPGFPGVFAKVSTYVTWIRHVIGGSSAECTDIDGK